MADGSVADRPDSGATSRVTNRFPSGETSTIFPARLPCTKSHARHAKRFSRKRPYQIRTGRVLSFKIMGL
jgi:hypothetical protein